MLKKLSSLFYNQYVFSIITKVFNVIIGVIYTVFQARFLGAEIKGQVATVNSIVSVLAIVFALGICQAYPYFKKNSKENVLPIFMRIALTLLAIYLLVDILVIVLFDISMKYIAVLIISPLLVYDDIVSNVMLIENPNRRHSVDALVMFLELVLVILFWLFFKPNFWLGIFIITIKDITKAIIFTFFLRKGIACHTHNTFKWFLKLVKFGFFPMISLLMATLNYRIDIIMLDEKVADAAIGVYSVGVMIAERVWMIPDALKGVLSSKLAKGKDASEVTYVIRLCNSCCLILIIGIILFGKPFINFLFGSEYVDAYQITSMLLIGVFSMIYYKTISAYNIVNGRQIRSFILLSVSVVSNIILNSLLIPVYGTYGAGWASVVSYTLAGILFTVDFCRATHERICKMILIDKHDFKKIKEMLLKRTNL